MAEEKSRDAWEKADALASIGSKMLVPIILVVATSLLSRGFQDRQASVSEVSDVSTLRRDLGV